METTELKVEGMTCGSCVAAVTKALQGVPGIADVEVDLRGGVARVRAEHASQQVPALVAALGVAGYQASPASGAPDARQHHAGRCGHDAPGKQKSGGGCCCH
jgi:copper chaperone